MVTRGMLSLIAVLALASALGAQTPHDARLLVTARSATPYQSLLLSVDTRTGLTTTLFDKPMGNLIDITMDRDNVGYAVVYEGWNETGLHYFEHHGAVASLVRTDKKRYPEATFLSADLTSEDCWIVGTGLSYGSGRLRVLVPGHGIFYEIESFKGAELSEILVERKTAKFIFALNGRNGVLYSYNPYNRARRTTLAAGLGRITDLIEDPGSGGYLVSTQDRKAPLLFVGNNSANQVITTFRLPTRYFPTGAAVDALAIDTRTDEGGDHALWALIENRLYRMTWNSLSRTIRFPDVMQSFVVPFRNPTAMIFEGDRDFLLTSKISASNNNQTEATLRLRLGPQYAHLDYYIGASLAIQPGIPVPRNRMINLAPDALFRLSISGSLPMVFAGFKGNTGPDGDVTGKVIGRNEWKSVLKGLTIYFAGVAIDPSMPGRIRTVTNTVGLTLF